MSNKLSSNNSAAGVHSAASPHVFMLSTDEQQKQNNKSQSKNNKTYSMNKTYWYPPCVKGKQTVQGRKAEQARWWVDLRRDVHPHDRNRSCHHNILKRIEVERAISQRISKLFFKSGFDGSSQ